jgi:hypothetical protein
VCYQNLINPSKSEQITYDKLMGELLTNNEIKYFSRELLSI